MTAYYNENDPKAAAWLRELIKQGCIAPGEVDDRSILDVAPTDLAGFTQCHFFAGIGVWSYALRQAGWADDRPVWTGSCPCQPFSAAGKGDGFSDERHLWPLWFHLIALGQPAVIFGEQVASKNADPWIDLVCDDLEAMDYTFGAVPFPAAGIGAPHIRDRTYWVADAGSERRAGERLRLQPRAARFDHAEDGRRGEASGMANSQRNSDRRKVGAPNHRQSESNRPADRAGGCGSTSGRLADTDDAERRSVSAGGHDSGRQDAGRPEGSGDTEGCGELRGLDLAAGSGRERIRYQPAHGEPLQAGPINGHWREADWIYCRDGKYRPVEPGTFPLAHGAPARVGRLRGYGNAIVAEAAAEFIRAYAD